MTEKQTKQRPNLWALLFFPITILYEEMLLRIGAVDAAGLDYHLLYPVVFAIAFGALFYAITQIPRSRRIRIALTVIITFLLVVVFCAEYCVKSFFQTFFEIGYMLTMSGDVTGTFANETKETIINGIPYILAALYPMLMLVVLHRKIVPEQPGSGKAKIKAAAVFAILEVATVLVLMVGNGSVQEDREYYTSEYSVNSAISRFGLMCSMQLESVYGIFGIPETTPGLGSEDVVIVEPTPTPDPVYGYNTLDIDFAALAEQTSDKTVLEMHQYFSSLTPTQKNEYTGMFEGKNLIYFVAEAFCPYVIDPELTPTLYKLSTEGFVFNNYYQPDWHQSTTGGEFAAVSGLVPTNVDGALSFVASARRAMPFALGNQFSRLGYACRAYHNNIYDFYSRDDTHPNLGYDYKGIHGGLKLPSNNGWPNSDDEMIQVTVDEYIDNYVNNGEKFHTYYMTVSGHAGYYWDSNRQAAKHKEEVAHLDQYSTVVKGYLAAQLEVEYALTTLMEKLEAAGIADETVIALTSDHYPYALSDKQYNELEVEDSEPRTLARFRNSFLLWCGSMDQPVVIDAPCSSIDILPTLSNLFGLEYDSRLFSGRDILSTNYDVTDPNSPQPFVISADSGTGSSWISLAGSYDASTKEFTPAIGYEVFADNQEYIKAMSKKAKNMFKYSKNIIAKDYYKIITDALSAETDVTAE